MSVTAVTVDRQRSSERRQHGQPERRQLGHSGDRLSGKRRKSNKSKLRKREFIPSRPETYNEESQKEVCGRGERGHG